MYPLLPQYMVSYKLVFKFNYVLNNSVNVCKCSFFKYSLLKLVSMCLVNISSKRIDLRLQSPNYKFYYIVSVVSVRHACFFPFWIHLDVWLYPSIADFYFGAWIKVPIPSSSSDSSWTLATLNCRFIKLMSTECDVTRTVGHGPNVIIL